MVYDENHLLSVKHAKVVHDALDEKKADKAQVILIGTDGKFYVEDEEEDEHGNANH